MSAPRVLVCGTVFAQGVGGVRRHNRELLPRVARKLEAAGGRLAVLLGRDGLDFELPASIERIASDVPATPAAWRAWHESAAVNRWVGIYDGFDGLGVERCGVTDNAMRFSTAVPEAVLFIEVADISHAVPNGFLLVGFLVG